jgi:hypothetical protein
LISLSEKQVTLDELMPLIREQLACGQAVTFFPRGVSMLPLLREGRDSVTLSAPPQRLKKYDIALYQRQNGQYVLHRAVRCGDTYTFIGDNQFSLEKGIAHNQIIAICTAFSRDGKRMSANAFQWRLYAFLWSLSRPLRHVIVAVWRRCVNLFQKSKKAIH